MRSNHGLAGLWSVGGRGTPNASQWLKGHVHVSNSQTQQYLPHTHRASEATCKRASGLLLVCTSVEQYDPSVS